MNVLSDYIKMIPKALSIITPLTPAVISNFFPYETELRTVLQPPVNINETTFYTTVYFILCTFVLLYVYALKQERNYSVFSALPMFILGFGALIFYYSNLTLPSRTLSYYGIQTSVTQYLDTTPGNLIIFYYAIFFFLTWAFATLGANKSSSYYSGW